MDNIIKLKRIEPPEHIVLDATEYYTLLSLLNDQIIRNIAQELEQGQSQPKKADKQ